MLLVSRQTLKMREPGELPMLGLGLASSQTWCTGLVPIQSAALDSFGRRARPPQALEENTVPARHSRSGYRQSPHLATRSREDGICCNNFAKTHAARPRPFDCQIWS